MPIFVGVHKIPRGAKEKDAKTVWKKYRQSCRTLGLKPITMMYSLEKLTAWCQTQARSQTEVKKTHRKTVIPLKDIVAVKRL